MRQVQALPPISELGPVERGMTLRDWFAGQALSGMNLEDGDKYIALRAYEIADAMMKAREATK